MSLPKTIDRADTEIRYGNLLKQICDQINPWMLFVVSGRGTAKSQEIIAERSVEIIYDMPGAPLAMLADTYINLDANILPAIQSGWKRKGYYEGIHYVIGKRPPEEWLRRCSIIVKMFKYTIFWFNGTVIFKGSLDRPSLLSGKSVVHIFSDEAKFQPDKKIANALPILRGDSTMYDDSTYFLGITATTDMPDINSGEYDWILRYARRMNKRDILTILDTFYYVNEARIALYAARSENSPGNRLKQLEKEVHEWERRLKKVRYEKVFFINSSSLMNIEILTVKYLRQLVESLDTEEFNKSVLGMRPALKRSQRFYALLSEQHFYSDGYDYDFFDALDTVIETCLGLKYIDLNRKLEAGLDTGNMLSLVVGQPADNEYRILIDMYEIPPHWFRELADKFLDFFRDHKEKELDLYYDRAANNYNRQGQDFAAKFREALVQYPDGTPTGWTINLKSRGQGILPMELEYDFMVEMLGEKNPGLPRLRIDKFNCPRLKSSLEKAPLKIVSRDGKKKLAKNKTSERLEAKRLPMESTNMSDAMKYLLMRREWIAKIKQKRNII